MPNEEKNIISGDTVTQLPIDLIDDFPDNPFHVVNDEAMQEMMESVKLQGVVVPAIVRPKEAKEDGRFELVSGHRRKMACQLAGIDTLPAIVRQLDRDEAILLMVDSNLQREKILPSEKAFSYKMRLEAMKRQGYRTDLTSSPLATKLNQGRSDTELGEIVGESKDQIRRYIRLTELIKPVLDMVDEGRISLRPAVEISYLPPEEQVILQSVMESEEATPSTSQAQRLRKLSGESKLTEESVYAILSEEKPNQKEKYSFRRERIGRYIPENLPESKVEDYIVKALEYYAQAQQRKAAARKNGAR